MKRQKRTKLHSIALSLAGLYQTASLVHQLAETGTCSQEALETLIHSVFELHPKTTVSVYGIEKNLTQGLKVLWSALSHQKKNIPKFISYCVFELMHLEKELSRHVHMTEQIKGQLSHMKPLTQTMSYVHPTLLSLLSNLYENTIGTLSFRIKVTGQANHLRNESVVASIRALLLAGIRSTVLWRQLGGTKWHFIFSQKKLMKATQDLLK